MNYRNRVLPAHPVLAVRVAILGIITAAIWLRVAIADRESVWRDEAQTVAIASERFPLGILEALRNDGNSPLFYLLEHFFVSDRAAPHRELQDRALSVVVGVLLIPFGFAWAWKATDGSAIAAVMGASAVAFSPVLVDLSTQVRPYSCVAVAAALMALAFIRLERSGDGWSMYVLGACCGFYLHALFATTIAAFAVGTLVIAWRRTSFRSWALAHLGVLIVIGPGLLFLYQQVQALTNTGGRIPWGATPTLDRLLDQTAVVLSGSEAESGRLIVVCLALIFGTIAAAANRAARALLLVAALALLLSFLLAIRSGGFETRYHVAPLTLTLLATSTGVATIAQKARVGGVLLGAGAIALSAGVNLSATHFTSRLPRSSARQAASLLSAAAQSDAIVIVPDTIAVAVNYYLPERSRQIDPPGDTRVRFVDFRNWSERLSQGDRRRLEEMIRVQARHGDRVWLVIWQPMLVPLSGLSRQDAARSALVAQWSLGQATLDTLAAHHRRLRTIRLISHRESLSVMVWGQEKRR